MSKKTSSETKPFRPPGPFTIIQLMIFLSLLGIAMTWLVETFFLR